ncbi:delta-lactam-biosynthetic de-N-acetylase [Lachnospiraceae bacterium MD1]|jgi:peptidoglycan-N-acetylmuramic acid deacetylase|uniref:Delta-lactam-biosynthetic de-N-acetylase n=1 Tax=Variimorphobacter saccharofermentans TaxID=2755051 RepID=A0A839K3L4_9FIRM|nr:delta-lactam-biosynthetic de-N-acetylase [Variimorphobacter saccharofermentans]MBB2184454.1 delta-lactam-biosynthetic de-N-acetylase [Variimorphobacter saccharofermentans]
MRKIKYKSIIFVALACIFSYLFGGGAAILANTFDKDEVRHSNQENWGLGFPVEGQAPTGNATAAELKKYDAYFIGDGKEKVIYLTFDAGYENGYTCTILDALKKHNVHATFFLVGNYITSSPDIVKRMVEEGHCVANHTYSHPNMSSIASMDAFRKELEGLEAAYEEVTGQKMTRYYRPPQGKYSISNLKMAKELGYKTFFWSLAYVDWHNDKQPTKEMAYDKLLGRIHPGAIVLLHSTSKTNAEIMDELLTKWEEMGYTFGTLDELVSQ